MNKLELLDKIRGFVLQNTYTISLYCRKIASTFVLLAIVRYLSVYDYGLYSSYNTIAMFALMIANLGYNDYILVSTNANPLQVRIKLTYFLIFAIIVSFLLCSCSMFYNLESHLLFILVVWRVFFDVTFFALILPYFQSSKKFNTIAIINIFYSIALISAAVITYILKLSLVQFLILNVIIGLLNLIHSSIKAKINYYLVFTSIWRKEKIVDKSIKYYMFVFLICTLQGQLPTLVISTYLAKEDVALFFAAFNIATIQTLFTAAQTQKIMPELIKQKGNELRKTLLSNVKLFIGVNFLIIIFFVLFGKFILHLIYNKSFYENSYIILLILAITNTISPIGGLYGSLITAKGYQKNKTKLQFEYLIVLILIILLVIRFGIIGMTCSFLLITLYATIRNIYYTKYLIKE